MDYQEPHGERRRHSRFSVALPVNIHLAGRPAPVTVEIVDIGAKGVRFRLPGAAPAELEARTEPGAEAGSEAPPAAHAGTRPDVRRINLDEQAAFGFVVPGHRVCVATGRVMRIVGGAGRWGQDEFVLSIERANDAFHGFLGSLAH